MQSKKDVEHILKGISIQGGPLEKYREQTINKTGGIDEDVFFSDASFIAILKFFFPMFFSLTLVTITLHTLDDNQSDYNVGV